VSRAHDGNPHTPWGGRDLEFEVVVLFRGLTR